MKYIQPQFQSLIHRLCAFLPVTKVHRSAPVIAPPPVRWQQLELNFHSGPEAVTSPKDERQPLVRARVAAPSSGVLDLERSA